MFINKVKKSISRVKAATIYKSNIPKSFAKRDEALKEHYLSDKKFTDRFFYLNTYFIDSFVFHSDISCTRCYFKGEFSYNSRNIDAVEGCTRFLPFLAAFVTNDISKNDQTKTSIIVQKLALAFENGTNPKSVDYWGEVKDYSQLICEAADVALAFWISKDTLYRCLSKKTIKNLTIWLASAAECKTVDNNWHLFKTIIMLVLKTMNDTYKVDLTSYYRIKSFYNGNGWFSDGDGEKFDYYNAWAFHYSLYWINKIDPQLDHNFIRESNKQFSQSFKYFFSPKGIPFFGRSVCYRMAAPCPLIASVLLDNEGVEHGVAGRAFDSIWRYFISQSSLVDGVPTQGYESQDLRFLDEYSGPGSSLWSLRSLILALQVPSSSTFFQPDRYCLPIETNSFNLEIKALNARLEGDVTTGDVKLVRKHKSKVYKVENYTLFIKLKEAITQRPHRPKNNHVKNELAEYSVLKPFSRL
ncbi:DUF2264 domain-containing protein [Alteromonas sp. A081]|uniref:DUF2264 domain-containing protein n=1 Tax=Alteromonas sp. A081 TaxID=3410269 RepID=UPI003B97F835